MSTISALGHNSVLTCNPKIFKDSTRIYQHGPNKQNGQPLAAARNVFDPIGAPGMIRTCDPLIRSQVLYPTELRVRRV